MPDLRSSHRAIALVAAGHDPWRARACTVLVATGAAAEHLRRTLERHSLMPPADGSAAAAAGRVLAVPALLTRDQWYAHLHARLADAPPMLTAFERYATFRAAARDAVASSAPPPFKLRPGLVAEVLAFYDELRRNGRTVERFEQQLAGELEPSAAIDRGARRLLRQTRFLAATFRAYQARLGSTGCFDEHRLRAELLEHGPRDPVRHVVVTIPDQSADSTGLWPVDFDLLTRMPGVEQVDVIATERLLETGFHERLHQWLPGLEEERLTPAAHAEPPSLANDPVLVVPPPGSDISHATWRDREEELLAVARAVKTRGECHVATSRIAVVFQHPLPYLYLARYVFDASGVPYEALDGLPLAAEPFAAAVDLVCAFVESGHSRRATLALLASPHFSFRMGSGLVDRGAVEALDRVLSQAETDGGRLAFERLGGGLPEASPVAALVLQLADELQVLEGRAPASRLVGALERFLRLHEAPLPEGEPLRGRTARARGAVRAALAELGAAYARHDDADADLAEVRAALHRWIESHTFAPPAGRGGVQLLDARAARYGMFAELFVVGLTEAEWPERPRRNIFYPPSLLGPLGWPRAADRLRAARAAFRDLLRLPVERVTLSSISLEDDTGVTPSALLDEVADSGLARVADDVDPAVRVSVGQALQAPAIPDVARGSVQAWLELRRRRDVTAPRYRGHVGPRPPDTYGVRRVEQYLQCPFQYFAAAVLRLGDDMGDGPFAGATRRGLFLHRALEQFFSRWTRAGLTGIDATTIERARTELAAVVDELLEQVREPDRIPLRLWMLGSAAEPGVGERVLAFEVETGGDVIERLLEYRFDGTFVLDAEAEPRRVRLRGVADRIDLRGDGTLRIIDYKAERAPQHARALQLPVYARCAEQQLTGWRGRSWLVAEAGYLALGEPRLYARLPGRVDETLADGARRFVQTIEAIERGEFPIAPADLYRCQLCPYPTVCRKDYVGIE